MDPRHQKRIKIIQELFSLEFTKQPKASSTVKKILKHKFFFNEKIEKHAPKFSIEKIAKIDLAILYLALYEILIKKNQPDKVIMNEAVELAKEYGSEKSYAFINAVLGKIYESEKQSRTT